MWRWDDGTELYHHGIKGQKWGIRRFQYEDGSLTPEGRQRYGVETSRSVSNKPHSRTKASTSSKTSKRVERGSKYSDKSIGVGSATYNLSQNKSDINQYIYNLDRLYKYYKYDVDYEDLAKNPEQYVDDKRIAALVATGDLTKQDILKYLERIAWHIGAVAKEVQVDRTKDANELLEKRMDEEQNKLINVGRTRRNKKQGRTSLGYNNISKN